MEGQSFSEDFPNLLTWTPRCPASPILRMVPRNASRDVVTRACEQLSSLASSHENRRFSLWSSYPLFDLHILFIITPSARPPLLPVIHFLLTSAGLNSALTGQPLPNLRPCLSAAASTFNHHCQRPVRPLSFTGTVPCPPQPPRACTMDTSRLLGCAPATSITFSVVPTNHQGNHPPTLHP